LFPNEKGIRHRDCARQIQRFLPGAIVHERTDYDGYLRLLNLCDIRLGSFPFGGANTTMDAYLLGIPTVTLAGTEPHGLTDALRRTVWAIGRRLAKAFGQRRARLPMPRIAAPRASCRNPWQAVSMRLYQRSLVLVRRPPFEWGESPPILRA